MTRKDPRGHRAIRRTIVAMLTLAGLLTAAPAANGQAPIIGGASVELSPESGAWQSGAPRYGFLASGFTSGGIRWMGIRIDGQRVWDMGFPCSPACAVQEGLTTYLPTTSYPDGVYTLTKEAIGGNGVPASQSIPLKIDNTPPAPPQNPVVAGGTGWRSQPGWRISWTNPKQRFAPLSGAAYWLCPAQADSSDLRVAARAKARCVQGGVGGSVNGRPLGPMPTALPANFKVPGPGLWTMRIALSDVAGNLSKDAPAVIPGLGYDPTPPQVSGFTAQDPNDPTRLSVGVRDDGAPVTGGVIEIQRRGAATWRALPSELRAGTLTAVIDDERLRRGDYLVRATALNAAGLQQGTDRDQSGAVKSVRLPIRAASRLAVGRRASRTCRGRGKRRRCRWKLAHRAAVPLGRRVMLHGRLTVAGRPVARQALEVWQRERLAGAGWSRIATVHTNADGLLRYKTREGVARTLRFRYPGTPHVRGDNGAMTLNVRARTTLRVSRRRVINGEYVTFRGRLQGGYRPPAGVLVELQVRSRSKWRTFAQPRADAATGTWRYQYRFETVTADARFRFRARVRRQAGYPFVAGTSRTLGVRIQGLG